MEKKQVRTSITDGLFKKIYSHGNIQNKLIRRIFGWFLRDPAHIFEKEAREKIDNVQDTKGILLDVGSGSGYYREHLRYDIYVSLDIDPETNPTVVGDAHKLPFKENSIDKVYCIALLEHIKDDEMVVQEIKRVLKEHGYIFFSVPFIYMIHGDPRDYRRYTPSGIKDLLSDYSKVKIYQRGGYFTSLAYLIWAGIGLSIKRLGIWFAPIGMIIYLPFYLFAYFDKMVQTKRFARGYYGYAKK